MFEQALCQFLEQAQPSNLWFVSSDSSRAAFYAQCCPRAAGEAYLVDVDKFGAVHICRTKLIESADMGAQGCGRSQTTEPP